MPLQSPEIRDLSSWNSKVSNSVWEISTPEKNSLYWSIILPYLIPSVRSKDPIEFARRLKSLTGDSEGSQAVMDQLKNFNPFKKKHTFHFGDKMTDVLQKFKKKINRSTKIRPEGGVEDLKLAAASKMLNCFIEVYRINSTGIENYRCYSPEQQSNNSSLNLDAIIIFHHPNTQLKNRVKDTFGFGIAHENSQPLKEKALTFILGKDKHLKENNAKIQQIVRSSENFLTSLLDSDAKDVIPIIYKSPYILAKLENAGYNTNPLVKGSDGLSAFYLCVSLSDSQYLNILYNYVANNFYQSAESCRKPGDQTVRNLNNLKTAFETDREISTRNSNLTDIAAHRYREMLRFNEYQINVVKIMKDNHQKSAEYTLLAILEEYMNYFFSHAVPYDERIQFEDYLRFSDYYENLDSYTCILLFDRLLKIENNVYSDLVEPFFLMMMSSNYFPRKEHDHDGVIPLLCKNCAPRFIPFKYRKNVLQVLKDVFDKLQNRSVENVATPVDMIIRSVQRIPKDEFLVGRLKTSLETAINVETSDRKGVLIIFRTLQILGEVFYTSITENFVSGFLLSAHIPFDIKQGLISIRKDISHYKAQTIQGRLNLETSTDQLDFIQKIQDELKLIYQVLEPVFSCQRFKIEEFFIQSATTLFQIPKEDLENIISDREIRCKKQWDQFKSFPVNVLRLLEKTLEEWFPTDSKKYSQKMKRIQDGAEALNLVFNFNDPKVTKDLTDARDELQNIIKILKESQPSQQDIENLRNTFQKYVSFLKQVYNLEVKDTNSVKCENLIDFKKKLRKYNVFKEENLKIRKLISNFFKPSFEATMKLETALKNSQSLPDIDKILDQTYLSNKNRKKIKATFSSKKSENLKILQNFSYNSQENALGEEDETSNKLLEMITKDEYKKALLQHSSSFETSLENKFLELVNQKMEFLIKSIDLIEDILIDENDNIRDLVKWGRSEEIKKHNKFLMRQRYVMELDVKLSLEMLLFDCMNITDKREDLANIYTKMNDMFAGVDLRDILSHGNILIDCLGTLLDPDDLPSDLITKMLELIGDRKTLKALSDLWMKEKSMTTEDLEIKIKDGDTNFVDIKNCTRWKNYAALLPTRN